MTNAEARCNKSLRPRKPEGSLGRTAQDVHLDSHTAPELRPSTQVLTLDNWGHKSPTSQKRIKDRKERLKGHGPKHVYNTLGYSYFPQKLARRKELYFLITVCFNIREDSAIISNRLTTHTVLR